MALFDSNPLSSLTNPVTSGLGNLFDGMSVFGTSIPSGILDTAQEEKLRKQALLQGLLGTAATYLATPKNLNTGSALPYIGKAFLGGMGASQDVIDRGLNNLYRQQLLANRDDKDKLYNVDGALVDRTGNVVYQGAAKEQERKTAVVGGVLVDASTGEKIFEAPKERKTLTVDGVVLDAETMKPLYKAPKEPKEINYSIQNDASGQAIYVPDKPGAQAFDMQGKPTTYTPALSPDQAKRQEKLEKQQDIPNLIKEAKVLLPKATGSGLGAARDIAAATVGQSTKGAQNLASLKAIQAALILKMPRLEGPQGVLDLKLYEAAAGDIGNPFVPAETKLKALETLEKFQDKYKNEITLNQPAAQTQQTNTQQSGGFKEGAKTKSKSGKSMIFRNGQWEYE